VSALSVCLSAFAVFLVFFLHRFFLFFQPLAMSSVCRAKAALLLLLPAAVACLRVPEPAAPRSTAHPSGSPQPLLSRRWAVGGLSGLLATAPLSDLRAASASTVEAAAPARALPNALCDSCVSVLQTARQEITLVGTAHISADSALLVQRVLRQVKPDTVMIELDSSRAGKLIPKRPSAGASAEAGAGTSGGGASGDEAGRAPPSSIGRLAGRVLRGKVDLQDAKADAVGVGLSSMYKQLDQMGFQSGEEFVIAVREADALGATLLLGDQDAKVTLHRLSDALGKVLFAPAGTYGTGAPLPAALVEAVGSDGAAAELTRDNVARSMEVLDRCYLVITPVLPGPRRCAQAQRGNATT